MANTSLAGQVTYYDTSITGSADQTDIIGITALTVKF
jgi:hypothetical protein